MPPVMRLGAGQAGPATVPGPRQAAVVLVGGTGPFTARLQVTTGDPQRPTDLVWVHCGTLRTPGVLQAPLGLSAVRVVCDLGDITVQVGLYDVTEQHLSFGVAAQVPASGVTPEEFDGLAGRVAALEGRATAVEGRATGLEGRMTAAEGHVAALRGDVDALGVTTRALSALGAAHEARLSALEARPVYASLPALLDVPDSYAGAPGHLLRVRPDLSGVEFVPPGSAGGGATVPAGTGSLNRTAQGNTNLKHDAGSTLAGNANRDVLRDSVYPGTPPDVVNGVPQQDPRWYAVENKRASDGVPQLVLTFTGNRAVRSQRLTFGVNQSVAGEQLVGAYAPTHVRAGYHDGNAWVWGDVVQPSFNETAVGTVECPMPAGVSAAKLGAEFWTTDPKATYGNSKFEVGEWDILGPGPVTVTGLPGTHRLLLAGGTEVRGTNQLSLAVTQRISVLDASGLEKASAVMTPGDTWAYAET